MYELTKLEELDTWSEFNEADIPQEAQVLPGMWVHLVKNPEPGGQKFRSQWVVRGDKQKTNLSLSGTIAPVSHNFVLDPASPCNHKGLEDLHMGCGFSLPSCKD